MSKFRDMLRVEGVNSRGYGILPKLVMLDRKLTIEAKAIYSYFCSYAGAGNQAFPGTNKIREDLCISKDRYYKHFNLLKDYGYIKVDQVRNNKGIFKHNIYTLVTNPEPIKEDVEKIEVVKDVKLKPSPENKDMDESQLNTQCQPSPENPDTDNPDTENKDTIINSPYKINKSLYKYQSVNQKNDRQNDHKKDIDKVIDQLPLENVTYISKLESKRERDKAIRRLKMILESLYLTSRPIPRGNCLSSPEQVRKDVKELLTIDVIDLAKIKMELAASSGTEIRNKDQYFASCIYNALFESYDDLI